MDFISEIRNKASLLGGVVCLPESDDGRMIGASSILLRERLVSKIVLIGDSERLSQVCVKNGIDPDAVEIRDYRTDEDFDALVARFHEKRKHKGLSEEDARAAVQKPLYYAAMLLERGLVDAVVAGAVNTTGDVLRAAIQGVGLRAGIKTVSSVFIMVTPVKEFGKDGLLVFGDCAVVPDPDPQQLADIAEASAATTEKILGVKPKVALMSFSTKGSAAHERVDKVAAAADILLDRGVTFEFDGELQADAALISSVAEKKAPGSPIGGIANCLIFPSLEAGNIGYKLVQRIAGAEAVGPVIQGLDKPYNALSRGCNVDDIVNTVCLTLLTK